MKLYLILRTIGYKFVENNGRIIARVFTSIVKELSGTRMTGSNEIYHTLN